MTAAIADVNLQLMSASALLDADPGAAARAAGEILKSHPDSAAARLLLATAVRRLGDADQALQVLEGLARAQPGLATLRLELARAYRAAGKGEQSLAALREAVELEPALAEAWRELSSQLAAAGDDGGADAAYARFASLAPDQWQLAEPAAALAENRNAAAEHMLRKYLLGAPEDVGALRLLAQALQRREDYFESDRLLRRCLTLAPGYSAARYDLARSLLTQEKPAQLFPVIERLLALDPDSFAYRTLLAAAYTLIGRHDQSLKILGALLEAPGAGAAVWLNYGHELKAAGKSQESVDAYRKSASLSVSSAAAYWSLANLKTFRFDADDVAAIRAALKREDLHPDERIEFEFAIAKALEDDGRFAESFEHYATGNSLRKALAPYDPERISAQIAGAKRLYTPQFFAERGRFGSSAVDPIFIVGLPRAGSTLLEQVLASHSQVEGTRELVDIATIARELGDRNGEMDYALLFEAVKSLTAAQVGALAERYLADTRIYRKGGRPRFIDKMPNNFLHIGLIHLMFPRASIIDARRHPMGCCLSCFKQHFAIGQRFTYDQTDLGRYYRDYVDLMAHFEAVLPGRVHRVHYEQVVKDLRHELLQLLDYCGLPFEEECLRFYENPRGVQTASAEQVRRPIFSESVDHWRHFEPWLGPLRQALGDLA